jgi:hypothetical protein
MGKLLLLKSCGRPHGLLGARQEIDSDYSAVTTTTATTRDAAQIDCATLGEQELQAG